MITTDNYECRCAFVDTQRRNVVGPASCANLLPSAESSVVLPVADASSTDSLWREQPPTEQTQRESKYCLSPRFCWHRNVPIMQCKLEKYSQTFFIYIYIFESEWCIRRIHNDNVCRDSHDVWLCLTSHFAPEGFDIRNIVNKVYNKPHEAASEAWSHLSIGVGVLVIDLSESESGCHELIHVNMLSPL